MKGRTEKAGQKRQCRKGRAENAGRKRQEGDGRAEKARAEKVGRKWQGRKGRAEKAGQKRQGERQTKKAGRTVDIERQGRACLKAHSGWPDCPQIVLHQIDEGGGGGGVQKSNLR